MFRVEAKVLICISILMGFGPSLAGAQGNTLKGSLLQEGDNSPIAYAWIFFSARPQDKVQSDQQGNFSLAYPSDYQSKTHYTLSIQPENGEIIISQMVNQPLNIFVKLKVRLPKILASVHDEEQEKVELIQKQAKLLAQEEENKKEKRPSKNPRNRRKQSRKKPSSPSNTGTLTSANQDPKDKTPNPDKILAEGLVLDTSLATLSIDNLTAALDDIRQKLILEKQMIQKRNQEIQSAIRWISDQLENESNLSPKQRQALMAKLEALEEQLEANKLAYNKLQETTHENIENIKRVISKQDYGFYINYNLIGSLLALILVLAILSFISNRVARGLRKQRNTLADKIQQINQQKAEIDQQNKEIKAQRDNLKTKNQQLEDLQQSKDQLTAMIAHDLRNPLNIILGYSKNLEKNSGSADPASQGSKKYIYQASQRISGLIDNMLDIQKYTKAGFHLQRGTYSVLQLAEKSIQDLRIFADQKGILVQNTINPLWLVDCDFRVVERVIENLFTNAIKYTPSGGQITFFSELNTNQSKVIISVRDTGEGIPSDKFSKIFEPFNQLDARRFAHTSSTGLGLTFCKMAIDAHGESLQVKSKVGEGTCFYFTLPLVAIEESSQEAVPETALVMGLNPPISLTKEEKVYLLPFKQELETLEIYEDSEIRTVLSKVNTEGKEALSQWKVSVQEAVDCLNEKEFKTLLSLA